MTTYFLFRDKIIKEYLILSTIFLALFFAFGEKSYAYGFILGAVISGINFYLISLNNIKLLNLSKTKSKLQYFILKWLFLRYILYFLALFVAIKNPLFSFGGTLIGFFAIQITLLVSTIILRES